MCALALLNQQGTWNTEDEYAQHTLSNELCPKRCIRNLNLVIMQSCQQNIYVTLQ